MPNVTEELYAANIPKSCGYQSMAAHLDMMLCWSLAGSLENGTPMNCGYCDLNTEVTKEQRDEHYNKLKTWRVLNDNDSMGR